MERITIRIKRKESAKDLPLPRYATDGASGMDVFADVEDDIEIQPGQIRLLSCGIYVSIPEGYEIQVRPRSGLALKHGITLLNTPGTIDSDYRGLVSVIIINMGNEVFKVRRGDRIAQLVVKEVVKAYLYEEDELDETVRSHGGFGHTGI